MKRLFALVLPVFLTGPALSDDDPEIVSASEFREYAEGYTLYFEFEGQRFGEEEFYEGGSTRWRYEDYTCADGAWRAHGDDICFYYNLPAEVLCWRVLRDEEGLYAELLDSAEGGEMTLRIVGRDTRPLLCGKEPATPL